MNNKSQIIKDVIISLKQVWIILSVISILLILISILDQNLNVFHSIPACPSKTILNKPCILCGGTSAYYLLSNGNFHEAWTSSKLACLIYIFTILNSIYLTLYLVKSKKLDSK